MSILVVDDSRMSRALIKALLEKSGYKNVKTAESASEAFEILGINGETVRETPDIDLVLLDIVMRDMDGIEACRRIKCEKLLRDIPVVMVTGKSNKETFEKAFESGAMDFISKPVDKIELKARIGSALSLKMETDRRKNRELKLIKLAEQLEQANKELHRLSSIDGLTGIANRRTFDKMVDKEWKRALRQERPIALAMIDIDYFKPYNDHYGHQEGDDCLKKVARCIANSLKRPGDFVARYGGEEFVIIFPEITGENATTIADLVRKAVADLKLPHELSKAGDYVSISVGVAVTVPLPGSSHTELIKKADSALYQAKETGRNKVVGNF